MTLIYRIIQGFLKRISPLLPWREPTLITGANAVREIPSLLHERSATKIVLFTDATLAALPPTQYFLKTLKDSGLAVTLVDATTPNPTTTLIDSLVAHLQPPYDAMISLGGGSVIDTAKATAVAWAKPKKSLYRLRGHFKVRTPLLFHIAIPTTAGSGSEATVAAVLTDPERQRKFALMDLVMIPNVAVLDPTFQVGLPQPIAAMTGMDALTHAIEAFLSRSATAQTNVWAMEAMEIIMTTLLDSVEQPENTEMRLRIQKAAYLAGCAFTRVYVGYVHALSHPLSAVYGTPHGLANACLLPVVLERYGPVIEPKMRSLAHTLGITVPDDTTATQVVIKQIKTLHQRLGLPSTIEGLQRSDVPRLIRFAKQEVVPTYPVPRYLKTADMIACYDAVMPKGEQHV